MAYEYELDEWRAAVAASSEMDRAHDEPDADDNNIGNQPGGYMDPVTLCEQLEQQAQQRRGLVRR